MAQAHRLTRKEALHLPPEAVVVAGIASATPSTVLSGKRGPDVDELVERLRPLLHGNTLWQPASVSPSEARQLRSPGREGPASWFRPTATISPATAETYRVAWRKALPPPKVTTPPGHALQRSLRLSVSRPDDARLLRAIGTLPDPGGSGGLLLVPHLRADVPDDDWFRWSWPMSVAVVDGPRADQWLDDLQQSVHYGFVYTAEIVPDPFRSPGRYRKPKTRGSGKHHDIMIVDAAPWTADEVANRQALVDGDPGQSRPYPATCVIAAANRSPAAMVANVMALQGPPIAASFPTEPSQWWYTFFHELCHDNPVDVAVARSERRGLVAVWGPGAELTAAARWFYAAAERDPLLAGQVDDVGSWDFTFERRASYTISRLSEAVRARTGSQPVVIVDRLRPLSGDEPDRPAGKKPAAKKPARGKPAGKKPAAKKPAGKKPAAKKRARKKPAAKKMARRKPAARKGRPRTGRAPGWGDYLDHFGPPAASPSVGPEPSRPAAQSSTRTPPGPRGRRLITEFWPDDEAARADQELEPLRAVLPPEAPVVLEVKIAVPDPTDDQIVADEDFPPVPTDSPRSRLEVVVRCDDVWDKPQRACISLPTAAEHLDRSSTTALFEFTTPPGGTVLDFDIEVLFRNRPLQAATLAAPVRTRRGRGEKMKLLTYKLTGHSEPTNEATPLDVLLNAYGAEIWDKHGNKLARTQVRAMLDDFESLLSKELGVTNAPSRLDDERARKMLVGLARRGTQLRDQLRVFKLGRKRSIDLLVNESENIFPLELVYDGATPGRSAKLCGHISDPDNNRQPKPCRSSKSRVCPYRFWGMNRVISRTVRVPRDDGRHDGEHRTTLVPEPVLYAATTIADEGSDPPVPSAELEEVAERLFHGVTRVTSWTKWRRSVGHVRPRLLVVLGHTDVEHGEVRLHIGSRSKLALPDIDEDVVARHGEPPPIVLLMACATATPRTAFLALPGKFAANGAGAVIATLSRINGVQAAIAAETVLQAVHDAGERNQRLSEAMTQARRSLVAQGLLVGLALVSHGEIDVLLDEAG